MSPISGLRDFPEHLRQALVQATAGHHRFLLEDENLRMHAAERTTVVVGSSLGLHQICQIQFARDGSIFVHLPYFHATPGVLKAQRFPEGTTGGQRIEFVEGGYRTTRRVKYTHHVDGSAHFSGDGKVLTQVRRRSFPLNGPSGFLFEITACWLSGYAPFATADVKKGRLYLPHVSISEPITAVKIVAQWRTRARLKHAIRDSLGPDAVEGPRPLLMQRHDGHHLRPWLLAAPSRFAHRDHVLLLTVDPAELPSGCTRPTMIFMGGWDEHSIEAPGVVMPSYGCLTLMYPAGSNPDITARMPSIDYAPAQSSGVPGPMSVHSIQPSCDT